jgi:hypothetical protein
MAPTLSICWGMFLLSRSLRLALPSNHSGDSRHTLLVRASARIFVLLDDVAVGELLVMVAFALAVVVGRLCVCCALSAVGDGIRARIASPHPHGQPAASASASALASAPPLLPRVGMMSRERIGASSGGGKEVREYYGTAL